MKLIRSEPKALPKNYAMCGNCHGTGQSDLGLGASWGGTCGCCDGKGMIYIDPNAKRMSLKEFLETPTPKEGEGRDE